MSYPENCPICTKEIFSMNTRRLGEIPVCNECHDILQPIMNGFALQLKEWMVYEILHTNLNSRREIAQDIFVSHLNTIFNSEIAKQIQYEINIA